MIRKGDILEALLCNCFSFTAVMIILSALAIWAPDYMTTVTPQFVLQVFSATTLIAAAQYFINRLPIDSQLLTGLLLLADVALTILGLGGGVYGWFPWETRYVVAVCIVFVTVFVITYVSILWQNKLTADQINEKIKRRQRDEPHD